MNKPIWGWLQQTIRTEFYTTSLFVMGVERYWQIAWSEYNKRRRTLDGNYKSDIKDTDHWKRVGHKLYVSFIDPQLFTEAFFAYRMRQGTLVAPTITELEKAISTIGLWFQDDYRPDAEGEFWEVGNKLDNLIKRYPDSTIEYWFEVKPEEFPAYFHLLYSRGQVDNAIGKRGCNQLKDLGIIRAIDRYAAWPESYFERLMEARRAELTKDKESA